MLLSAVIIAAAGCSSSNKEAQFDPNTGKHPADWIVGHRVAFLNSPNSCTPCHGTDLRGGISAANCFSASFSGLNCHGPSWHLPNWENPDSHGASAKAMPNITAATGFAACQICHGANFAGDIGVTCLNNGSCHGTDVSAPHSPQPWRGGTRTHTNTNEGNAPVCGLCHLGNRTPPAYVPLQPGTPPPDCFNNTLCHGAKD